MKTQKKIVEKSKKRIPITEGEWLLNPLPNPKNPQYYCLYVKNGGPETIQHIAQIGCFGLANREEIHGNAKAMAAGPRLLKTCETILALLKVGKNNVYMQGALEDAIKEFYE